MFNYISNLFYLDNLSYIMMILVFFVSAIISSFSLRYLRGDRKKRSFYLNLMLLILLIYLMVCADNLILFLISWMSSNLILSKMMLFKKGWKEARESSVLALKNYCLGGVFLALAFLFLYLETGSLSIQFILKANIKNNVVVCSSAFLILSAMMQSAIWPFHSWLLSSLNSPTPISALMHAGIINGGGFMLTRFAGLFLDEAIIMNLIFALGIVTAFLGTFWKLIQSDVKRMLACSTMGQMGFMFAQCGLGLFPAAIAHLCFHGLFKAYLFLSSGSAAQEERYELDYPPDLKKFILALISGLVASYSFVVASEINVLQFDASIFLVLIAFLMGTQISITIITNYTILRLPIAMLVTSFFAYLYGLSIHLDDKLLEGLGVLKAHPLNILHFVAIILLFASWLYVLFFKSTKSHSSWFLKLYVKMLNASQPHSSTVTTNRNNYKC